MKYTKNLQEIQEVIETYKVSQYFDDIERYLPYFSIFRAGKKEQVFHQAEERKEVYLLLSGKVKVSSIVTNGKQLLIDYYDDVELFGEQILSHRKTGAVAHFYTETMTDVLGLALHVPLQVLRQLAEDVHFLHFHIACLESRFAQMGSSQPMNVLNSSERNVAGFIYSKMYRDKTRPFYFKENLREVSEILGISYRHLHRVLHKLIDDGILERTNQGYLVTDEPGIKEIIDDE